MAKCNAHQLEKWNFCSRFQTYCAGEHCRFYEDEEPLTNADRIRSMSDEELCDFILEKRENGTCFNDRCYVNDPNKGCDDCTMEWLKQPYKENADGKK